MIHKTYEHIGSLSREQRLIAKIGAGPEVSKNLATLDIASLQSKASTLSELVKLINANSVSRTERVKRAKQAAEIAGKATEAQMAIGKKKLVLEASRQIMQNAIDESKAEFNSDTVKETKKAFLKTEQTQIEESQKELEAIESNLAALDKKEVESSKWKWVRLLAYGGAALAGGAAARWVWEHTIGWMWDNTVGSKEKPGIMRKLASILVTIGGSVGGYLGLQWLSKKFNFNLFSKGKELWDKYGMDKTKYYTGLGFYKAGNIAKAKKIWGEKADEIIADLEAKRVENTKTKNSEGEKDIVKKGEEIISSEMASRSLALQYDVAEKIDSELKSPKPLLRDAREILALAAEKKIPMGIVFDCMDAAPNDNAPYAKLLAAIYSDTNHQNDKMIKAARLVIGFIAKFREKIEHAGKLSESGDVRKMPLNEALNVFTHMSGAIHGIATALAEQSSAAALDLKLLDPMSIINGIMKNRKMYGDRMIEVILAPIAEQNASNMTPDQRKELRKACIDVSSFFLSREDIRLNAIQDTMKWSNDTAQYKIAFSVAKAVRSNDFLERIKQSIFITPNSTNDNDIKIVEKLKWLIQGGEITLSEAFRLFYLEKINKDNGVLLMAQVIKILDKHGHYNLAIDRYNTIGDKIIECAKNAEWSIPELNLSPAQERELKNVGLYMKDCGVDFMARRKEDLMSFAGHHPWVTSAIASYVGYKVIAKPSLYAIRTIQWKMINKFANMDEKAIRALSAKTGRPILDILLARDDALRIFNKYRDFKSGVDPWHWPFYEWRIRHKALKARLRGRSLSSASTAEIRAAINNQDDIAKLLRNGRTLSEILDQADNADEYARITKAFKALKPAERISRLREICTLHSVEMLKDFGLANDLDEIAKAVVKIKDSAIRGTRLKELMAIHKMSTGQLLMAGANPKETAIIVKALGSTTDEMARTGVAAASVMHGKPTPLRAGGSGPRTPPSGTSSVVESADDVAKAIAAEIRAAINGSPDDIVKLLRGGGRTLHEILMQAKNANEYARLASALKMLNPAERIAHLSEFCTSNTVAVLQQFFPTDNFDEIVKAVAKIGDATKRLKRLKELRMILQASKKAGENVDNLIAIVKALESADEVVEIGRGSRTAAAAAAATASRGIPPPIPTGSDDVVLTARQSIKNIVKLRNHAPTQLVLRQNGEEAAKLIQIAHKANGVTGAKRAARYMLSFTDDIDKARRSAMLAPEMLQLVAKGEAGNPAAIARFLGGVEIKAGTTVTGEMLAKAAKTMTRWQKAGTGMRTLYFAGAALEAGALVFDIYQYKKAKEELANQKVVLHKALTEAGLTSDGNGKYSGCGVAIDIKDVEDTNVEEYLARSVAGGAGLLVTLVSPSMCLGPAGLVVAGVIITAHLTIGLVADEIEKNKHQKFLDKAPHWLLAMLGTQTFIRQSYHQTIREYTRDDSEDRWKHSFGNQSMMTNRRFNPNPSKQSYEKQTEKERLDLYRLRKKLIQSMSYRAISINYPDLLIELPGMNNEGPTKYAGLQSFLDPKGEFLKSDGDFDRIVLPYVLMRLHAATINEGISFNKTKDLDITDNIGGFFDGKWLGREIPTVSDYELEKTVEEAMLFYIQHIKERRYRGQLDKIKHMIEQEKTRLDGISTLTPIQRKEETLLYGRALHTVLTEEMEENRDISYVLNQDPATLPVYPNGKTLVEHLIQERYQAVSNATDSTSAKTAKEGWSLTPTSEVMDIDRFAGRYIRPQFRELDKKWLKTNSPGKGDPFSFEELNIMGKTDEDFRKEFESKMAPLIDVANGIRTGIRTDEDLKQFAEKMGPKIDFYVKFYKHEYYYRRYIDKWRPGSNIKIEEGSQLIPVLREWRNSKYPRLISNEFFGGWVDNVKNRKAIYPQNQLRIANSKIRINQAIKNIMNMDKIPGMSLINDVKGTHLYSYDGYIEMMQQLVKKAKSEKINIPIPFESIYEKNTNRGSRLFDVNDSKNPLYKRWNYADRTTNKYAQVDANEIKPPRMLDLKKFIDMDKKKPDTQNSRYTRYPSDKLPEDSSSFYVDELGRPQQIGRFVNYRHKNETVAVTPYELEKMLSELGVLPQAPGQNFIIQNPIATRKSENDGFAALREHLVKSNVLVIANPELIKYEIEPRKIYRRSQ